MSIELACSRPLASAAELKTLPAIDRPMARLAQTKRWRIKDGAWTMTSPISISKLTAQECAALAVASLTNRPDKVARVTWAKGVAAWRSEHHCPLVFGELSLNLGDGRGQAAAA
jgi:hypothetical protein